MPQIRLNAQKSVVRRHSPSTTFFFLPKNRAKINDKQSAGGRRVCRRVKTMRHVIELK